MDERRDLLGFIAKVTADYRGDERGSPPSPESVDRWIRQFDGEVQVPILREMRHVLQKTYLSRSRAKRLLHLLFKREGLAGQDPCAFWQGVKFIHSQGPGTGQSEMLAIFSEILQEECGRGISLPNGEPPHYFAFLDDVIYTGGTARENLEAWLEDAPSNSSLYILSAAYHTSSYYSLNKVREAALGKGISVTQHAAVGFENRKGHRDVSRVLWPTEIPEDPAVQKYVEGMGHPPVLRNAGAESGEGLFSSAAGRHLLEQEFLRAGVRIREMCPNLPERHRPLGYSPLDTLGFGSTIVTFRNCPNNAPLALWAHEPWHPLFPRKTRDRTKHEFTDIPDEWAF